MLDNTTALAYSAFHNKGVYTLLLGSGVSRSAGIPTGWEITLDLIRQVAAVAGEDAGIDPETWLRDKLGMSADYSKLLDQLAKTPDQRRAVLARYIEPTADERAEGQKAPTPAHRAIAEMVRRGYIRVIVTTNFDRLLEIALRDVGIEPTVLATDDAIKGAVPITHSQCTIVKVHGDYLDTRIKNTDNELTTYTAETNELLDRIFDEFGLIVCGWSASWDQALADSLSRCKSRRYSTYWAARGKLTSEAQALANQRKAEIIRLETADTFFSELDAKLTALEEFSRPHPLSADMAVAMVKRYIVDESARIKLNDLVEDALEDVFKRIPADMLNPNVWSREEFLRRAAGYEGALVTLLPAASVGARWSERRDESIWLGAVARVISLDAEAGGYNGALDFRRYPALLLYYAIGIGAVAGGRYSLLKRLLTTPVRFGRAEGYLTELLNVFTVAEGSLQKLLPGQERKKTALSNHLAALLKSILPRDVIASDFENHFDTFEILVALAEIHRSIPGDLPSAENLYYVPAGRFIWKQGRIERMIAQLEQEGTAPWLDAGFFEASKDRALSLLKLLLQFAVRHNIHM